MRPKVKRPVWHTRVGPLDSHTSARHLFPPHLLGPCRPYFFWIPFGSLLAVYSVRDQANPVHTESHQSVTRAGRLLERFPPERTAWILYYTCIGMACATQMAFMAVWYRKKVIINRPNARQIQASDEVEMVSVGLP
jgi:hypothetical protein